MSQSAKTLVMMAVLLVLAGGVGLYAYYGVYEKDEKETKKKDHEARLFAPQKLGETSADGGAPPAEFTKVTVTSNGETTVLEREPGKSWRLTAPVKAAADKLVMDALVSQLQTAKFKATLEENPDAESLKRWGLDAPKFIVEAQAQIAGEIRSVRLEGGAENTFDGSVFMRKDGLPTVYSAEGGVRYALSKSTFELREKQVLLAEEPKLKKLEVKAKANSYTLERNAEGKWALTAPASDLADSGVVLSMLNAFGGHRAQKFPVDTPDNRKAFGLEKPLVDATFTTQEGQVIRFRLSKGGTPEAVYALREDSDGATLAEVPEAAMNELDRNPAELKDRTLLRFQKELVTKVIFHNADGTEVVVGKDSPDASAEAWRVLAPREGKAQVYKVTSVLWTLGAYKANTIVTDKEKDFGKYGIGPKSRFIALLGPDGELARLTIGDAVPNKPDTFYVRGSRALVAEVDGARFRDFPTIVGDVLEQPKADDAGAAVDGGR
ncbi:MAG: DUF4340 domain-containing protein [Myxococcota bacterium]